MTDPPVHVVRGNGKTMTLVQFTKYVSKCIQNTLFTVQHNGHRYDLNINVTMIYIRQCTSPYSYIGLNDKIIFKIHRFLFFYKI